MRSTKVRKLSMDEYQTKYKYNDSAYLRDINTEVSIESKYYKDFFTRLNRIRDFHMTEDTKPRTGANINKDYYSFFGYPIDSNKKSYKEETTWDDSTPGEDEIIYKNQLFNNPDERLQSAIKNLIQNLPKIQNGLSLKTDAAIDEKLNEITTGINVDTYITKNQYNTISNFIKQIEEICAHNSTDYSHCGSNYSSDNSDHGSSGGGGSSSRWSPVMQNGSGCPNNFSGCSGNCDTNRSECPTHQSSTNSNYPDVSCNGYAGTNTRYSTN